MKSFSEQANCGLCGMLFASDRVTQPTVLSIGFVNPDKVLVCGDSSACRRRAIEIMRAYERMKL